MRKNVERRERTVVEELVTYVAFDGKAFHSDEECEKYEETAECAINAMFNGVKQHDVWGDRFITDAIFNSPCTEDEVKILKLDSLSAVEAANKWLKLNYADRKEELFTAQDVGTIQLVCFPGYESEWYRMGTAEEVKKNFSDYIDSLVAVVNGEAEKEED